MSQPSTDASEQQPTGRPCPVCSQHLTPTTFKGVVVDVCEGHGLWLDDGELKAILNKQRRNRKFMHKMQLERARKDGKVRGALFGWWSLLGD